jgi:signal peptidase I
MPEGGSRAALHRVMALTRWIRYGVYLSILVMLWWMLSTFSFVRIQPGDDSIEEVSGYRRILVERFSGGDEPVERGDVLVFGMLNAEDQPVFRVSRAVAVPGDLLGAEEGRYIINGKPTSIPVAGPVEPGITIPEDAFFLVNDNPLSRWADSLRLGLIRREWIVGRFLSEMPF